MKKINNFTEGKILPSLIIFALPVLLSLFLQTMYGAVDMMIVGWFGTDADVTAISTGSWIMSMAEPVSVFGIGLATPCSTVVQITLCFIYFYVIMKREKKLPKNKKVDFVNYKTP